MITDKSKHNVYKRQLINSKINYICKYSETFIVTQGILDICWEYVPETYTLSWKNVYRRTFPH